MGEPDAELGLCMSSGIQRQSIFPIFSCLAKRNADDAPEGEPRRRLLRLGLNDGEMLGTRCQIG